MYLIEEFLKKKKLLVIFIASFFGIVIVIVIYKIKIINFIIDTLCSPNLCRKFIFRKFRKSYLINKKKQKYRNYI